MSIRDRLSLPRHPQATGTARHRRDRQVSPRRSRGAGRRGRGGGRSTGAKIISISVRSVGLVSARRVAGASLKSHSLAPSYCGGPDCCMSAFLERRGVEVVERTGCFAGIVEECWDCVAERRRLSRASMSGIQ